jgi:hypothetical protein
MIKRILLQNEVILELIEQYLFVSLQDKLIKERYCYYTCYYFIPN